MSCRCLEAAAVPLERLRKKHGGRAVTIRCLADGRQVFASEVSLAELLQRLGLTAGDGEATLLFSLGTGDNEGGEANSVSFNALSCNGLRCGALDSTPEETQNCSHPETSNKDDTDQDLQEQKNEGSVKQEDADSLTCSEMPYENICAYYSLDQEDDGYEADDEDESLAKEAKVYKAFEDDVSVALEDEGYDGDDEEESLPNKEKVYTYNDADEPEEEGYEGDIEDEFVEEETCEDSAGEDDEDGKTHHHGQTLGDWCTVGEEEDVDDWKESDGGVVCSGGDLEQATNLRHRRPPTLGHKPVTATRKASPVKRRGDFWLEVVAIGAAVVLLVGLGALLGLTLWLDFGQPLWRVWQDARTPPAMPCDESEFEDEEYYYYDP